MKLAYKIFLSQLVLIFLVLGSYSCLMISTQLSSGFARELELCSQTGIGYRYYYSTVLAALGDTGISSVEGISRYLQKGDLPKEREQELLLTCGGEILLSTISGGRVPVGIPEGQEEGYWVWKEGSNCFICYISHFEVEREVYSLITLQDISYLFEQKEKQLQFYMELLLYITAASSVICAFITWRITGPIKTLKTAAVKFSGGDLSSRSRVKKKDEIGELSGVFDEMADVLQMQLEQLKESVRKQEEFSASFAHEMKTPLTSVIGYASILRSERLPEEQTFYIADYIYKEGRRMEHLSMQLLDLIVNQRNDFQLVNFSITDFMEEMVELVKPIVEENHVAMRIDIQEYSLAMEPTLFTALCQNLIANSIKAMETKNEKHLTITGVEKPDYYELSVADNGKGICGEDLKHILEPFYRVEKSRDRKNGGNGLGLSLCRQIAKIHHGTIDIKSKEKKGTCVVCRFRKQAE